MARLHSFPFHGYLAADISDTATTMTSPALSAFPVVAGADYAMITFVDTGEIVKITAHTSASTSATIVRGQDLTAGGTAAVPHKRFAQWVHAPISSDYPAEGGTDTDPIPQAAFVADLTDSTGKTPSDTTLGATTPASATVAATTDTSAAQLTATNAAITALNAADAAIQTNIASLNEQIKDITDALKATSPGLMASS